MGRRRWKRMGLPGPNVTADADPVTRSLAIHGSRVAVAAGRRWRIVDVREQAEVHSDTSHGAPVRGIQFSPDGSHLLTCGDDKTARTWRTADWQCLRVLKSAKKASCCAFSSDGRHVFFADRFGDVLGAATTPPAAAEAAPGAAAADAQQQQQQPAAEQPSLLLGHLQSVVTSLTPCAGAGGRRYLVSTDRDARVRVNVLPDDPTKGSYEIQAYCWGHTNFVTCSAAVPLPADAAGAAVQRPHLLLTGGGDGTVRLWDADSGRQLACFMASEPPKLPEQQQQQQQQQEEEGQQAAGEAGRDEEGSGSGSEDGSEGSGSGSDGDGEGGGGARGKRGTRPRDRLQYAAVLSLSVSPDGATVAAAVEGQQEVQLLRLDAAAGTLELKQKLCMGDVSNPAAVAFDGEGRVWVAGGALLLETESAHVGVAAEDGGEFRPVTGQLLGEGLRAFLERRMAEEEAAAAQQAAAAGYYHEGFKRKVYSRSELEERKRVLTDVRESERLRALWAAEEGAKQEQEQEGKE